MARAPGPGPRPTWKAGRVIPAFALFVGLSIAGLIPFVASEPAAAADVPLTLYANVVGWSLTSGNEDNPGPTLVMTTGDHVWVSLTSEDGLEHGLWIDYNKDSVPNGGDYLSPKTTSTVNFDFTADVTGQFEYYDQVLPINHGSWVTNNVNHAPTATLREPASGSSWTGGAAHDIVFDVSDLDGDSLDVVLTYSYNGGAAQPIAGPIPAGTNPNRVSWTPPNFDATDTIVHLTVQDARGLSASADSPPFQVDSTAPTITLRSPARDAAGVSLGTGVSVTWSEPMRPTSGNSGAFGVSVVGGAWLTGSVSWSPDGTRMTFQPSSGLGPGTSYEVHVNATARDDSDPGNAFAGPDIWTFSTGTTADQNPPTILSLAASPRQQVPGGFVNLTAEVQDDAGLAGVSALTSGPGSSDNLTMSRGSGTLWYLNRTYGSTGHYSVLIWAMDAAGNSVSQATGFDIGSAGNPNLPAPASVTVTAFDDVIEVSWSPVASSKLVGYHVYRREASEATFVRLTVSPFPASMPTVYRDGSAESGRTYFYTVTAVDTSGSESAFGPAFSVTIPPYQSPPLLDPVPWAVAGVTLGVILGALYGTIWRRKAA